MRCSFIGVISVVVVAITVGLIIAAPIQAQPRMGVNDPAPNPLLQQLARDNTAFGMDLYAAFRENDGNIFFSPYSISEAFAMIYAGARGQTADEMSEVLHITLDDDDLHDAYRSLVLSFEENINVSGSDIFRLNIANGLWAQEGYPIREEYISILRNSYQSEPASLDFVHDAEGSRRIINSWISDRTENMIQDILQPGTLNSRTRLVLANTIYFDARWRKKFNGQFTRIADFHRLDNTTVSVPLMSIPDIMTEHRYADGPDWQAVELAYTHQHGSGGMAMLVILPRPGLFPEVESRFNEEFLASIDSTLEARTVSVVLPKFTFTSPSQSMKEILTNLGMITVFDSMKADLSGIYLKGSDPLFVDNAYHKASITVAEDGTVASAGTVVEIRTTGVSMDFTANRPFIFLIRDLDTNSVLFMGRVLDPTEQ